MKILISKELWQIREKFDNSLTEDGLLPMFDFSELKNKNICGTIKDALNESDKTIIIANSVTHECYKALFSDNPGLIIFSAKPNNFNNLLENGLKPNNLIFVGARKWTTEEMNMLREKKIKVYPMKEIIAEGIHEIPDSIMSVAKDFSELYVSIDISVVDPCFAPGVSFSVPGGLSSRELLFFIQRLKNLKNLKMADIAGINLNKDTYKITQDLIVKVVTEFY